MTEVSLSRDLVRRYGRGLVTPVLLFVDIAEVLLVPFFSVGIAEILVTLDLLFVDMAMIVAVGMTEECFFLDL